jgi:hypothetical protein
MNSNEYFRQQLEDGQAYQDFIAQRLARHGIILNNFQSRDMQRQHGENMLGLEIKYDKKFQTTQRLWIECAEKYTPGQALWGASGIDRQDQSWLFGIGDYAQFFLFSKRTLRRFRDRTHPAIIENDRHTSRGFLLALDLARAIAEREFRFTAPAVAAPIDADEPTLYQVQG